MQFTIDHTCPHSDARTGVIKTAHGDIQTPVFMPVGTAGAIKAVTMEQMEQETDARIILGNTYHLYLRPGIEILKEVGGLHCFGTWSKPILTDSGGYQVFSLAAMRRITPEGVTFASHIDGSRHLFTPERVMEIERAIGADIMMAFDECCPGDASYAYAKQSLDTTEHIASLGAPGNAIGGLAVGEPTDKMYEMIELTNSILPKDKPRYLMGVGTPANILEGIARGVDMFDCIMPTRNARNGQLFTWQGTINIRNAKWRTCHEPIDPEGTASTDHRYTRAYLYHLFKAQEIMGLTLASIHNIAFYLDLVNQAHDHIVAGDYTDWMRSVLPALTRRL